MNYFQKIPLSASDHGRQIKITTSSSPGTILHTATAEANSYDEIWLWATGTAPFDVEITLLWGGTTFSDDYNNFNVLAKDGYKCIVPGLILANGYSVACFASTVDSSNIIGYVNRITTS
jgi:hypothetical protein